MAKEIPYFRFTVQEWQNGNISFESYELKGLFIDVCGFYWVKDCSINISLLEKRFKDDKDLLNQLISLEIIKVDDDGNVNINFLDDQFDLLSEKRQKRQEAGRKGGLSKSSNARSIPEQSLPKESDAIEAIPPDSGKGRLLKPSEKEEAPSLTESDELVKKATDSIAAFFNISEMLNASSYMEIGRFVQHLANKDQMSVLSTQFNAYKELKILDGCKHSWKNYIGDPKEKYQNGSWCEKTWKLELTDYRKKQNKQTNGTIDTPTVLSAPRRANRTNA